MREQLNINGVSVFNHLSSLMSELYQQLETRFILHPDSSTKDLQTYSSLDGNITGSLQAYTGDGIDWLTHSWLGNAQKSFAVMRLTVWLNASSLVPHLTFEFGLIPQIFLYIDYIPRIELLTNLDYLQKYYQPVNSTFLQLQDDSRLTRFISKSVYMRAFQSPVSLCYTSTSPEVVEVICTVAKNTLNRWLTWVDTAEQTPENAKLALAERDLFIRRSCIENDPDNEMAVKMFGKELTEKLVRSLSGSK
ncbi:red chlorophyll catabolite reductase [Nostoc sp. CMAA1605]|uniref:red chlorophyll catabolite reductase n=1 Tax=Nostoc sp. CMAA1605 TaxID=2055159 RepID=UPI001F1C1817|nr:red chlorophyll catabolite reductase [Nostoc sp. CMAA1605]MCF4966371.1 red chlorophyll catabolite reductase [Nostoc sp. CMAA1605]